MSETKDPSSKLNWAIYDDVTSTLIKKGEKLFLPKDIKIRKIENAFGVMYDKRIELEEGFTFGLAEDMEEKNKGRGFGLTGGLDDQDTFSWEWFEIDREEHATKLQELGEVKFETAVNVIEINYLEFLTDVSIRVSKMKAESDSYEIAWRIKIFQGSSVIWPSAVI